MWEIYIWFAGLPAPRLVLGPSRLWEAREGWPALSVLKTMSRKNGSDRQAEGAGAGGRHRS